MFLKNKIFKILSLVFVLFAFGLFYSGVTNAAVEETYVDFSDVDVGLTATRYLNMTNLTGRGLYAEFSFGTCSCGTPFTIETSEIYIGSYGNATVEVYFTPSSPGECSTILYVFYGFMDWEEVEVTGTGIGITPRQTEINGLLEFFNRAVEAGTLVGSGPGKSADHRLEALRNMIMIADDLIKSEDFHGACGKLQAIYKKIDGLPKPQDFVEGDADTILDLRNQVLQVMEGIGCK